MILRSAQARDAAGVAAIWNPIIRDSAITFTTDEKTIAGLCADFTAKGPSFIVAEEAGEILGFATYGPFRNGPGYARTREHTILLGQGARGRGVGRALMAQLLTQARADGIHSMWAGVSAENPGAVTFHKSVGFTEIARLPEVGWKFGRWIDLVLLQKIL